MAYSLRTEELPVNEEAPDTVWFGYEPPIVPFSTVAKSDDAEKLKAAQVHLDKALKLYEDALKLTPDDLRAQLGHGVVAGSGRPEDRRGRRTAQGHREGVGEGEGPEGGWPRRAHHHAAKARAT